ncbi:MAG: hypothetical protein ACAH81_12960 [Actinomycetota bacterium]
MIVAITLLISTPLFWYGLDCARVRDSSSGDILAMGGGDLLSPDSKLEELLLHPAGKAPRVAFLPTAVADSGERGELFLEAFRKRDCEPEVVTLFGLPERWWNAWPLRTSTSTAATRPTCSRSGACTDRLGAARGLVARRPRRVSPPASCSTPITRSGADRASLIGRLYARADAEWLAERLMEP